MLQSMTGYGKAETEFQNKKITVEVKSLNSKQADISTRVPSVYKEKDLEIRNIITQSLVRGKIDLYISTENEQGAAVPTINADTFAQYKKQIEEIAKATDADMPEDLFSVILRLPEVMKGESQELTDEEWDALRNCLMEALSRLNEFRCQEGAGLEAFFTERLDIIERLLKNDVPMYEKTRVDKIKGRLIDGLKDLDGKVSYDENRLEQELIFYIEKLDISEEKQRLQKHIDYFRTTMQEDEPQGKKLGFIAQEMGREINTLGSKANHAELQIVVVKMKDELEKIKEQVLNVL